MSFPHLTGSLSLRADHREKEGYPKSYTPVLRWASRVVPTVFNLRQTRRLTVIIHTDLEVLEPMLDNPQATAYITDFDGTAAPFNPDPGAVRVEDASQEAFDSTSGIFGFRAVLTGRAARDAASRLPRMDAYAGIYGAELYVPATDELWQDEEFFRLAPAVENFIERWRSTITGTGMRIQVQGSTRLIHWSGLPDPSIGERLAATLAREAENEGLVAHFLSQCLDIRPGNISKGTGIDRLLAHAGQDIRNVVYFDDDKGSGIDAFVRLIQRQKDGRLDHVARVAVVHPDRPENEPLWALGDIRVRGVREVRGLTSYLVSAAR